MKKIYFDLDGTLIDSAPSIISTLNKIFDKSNIKPTLPINSKIIGPSIDKIIRDALNENDEKKIEYLINEFKKEYDFKGYLKTKIYDGITHLLDSLKKENYILGVVTNKRIIPTIKITNLLSINKKLQI